MDKEGHFEGEMIFRRTICEGNMHKVGHLMGKRFQGVPFVNETWIKYAI